MLDFDDIKVEFESQGFRCSHIGISPEKDKAVMFMESTARVDSVICPYCQHSVRMIENVHVTLRDMVLWPSVEQKTFVSLHRYQCSGCAPLCWSPPWSRPSKCPTPSLQNIWSCAWTTPLTISTLCRTQVRCSSAKTAPNPSATTLPVPTIPCPPAAPPASPVLCPCMILSSGCSSPTRLPMP